MSSEYVTIGQPPFLWIRGQKLPSVKRANRNIQQHRSFRSGDSIAQISTKCNPFRERIPHLPQNPKRLGF